MTTLVKPGLLFQAAPIFGGPVQGAPCPNTTYVVCQDGSVQNYHEPMKPVGWTLTEDAVGWYYDGNKPLAVYFRGRTEDVPPGRSKDSPWTEEVWRTELGRLREHMSPLFQEAGIEMVHNQDLQNCLCEFDKYERVRLGEGRPRAKFP